MCEMAMGLGKRGVIVRSSDLALLQFAVLSVSEGFLAALAQ